MKEKVIKAIHNRRYGVELLEKGYEYIIQYGYNTGVEYKRSETVKDLNIAIKLFDMKVQDLEAQ